MFHAIKHMSKIYLFYCVYSYKNETLPNNFEENLHGKYLHLAHKYAVIINIREEKSKSTLDIPDRDIFLENVRITNKLTIFEFLLLSS